MAAAATVGGRLLTVLRLAFPAPPPPHTVPTQLDLGAKHSVKVPVALAVVKPVDEGIEDPIRE